MEDKDISVAEAMAQIKSADELKVKLSKLGIKTGGTTVPAAEVEGSCSYEIGETYFIRTVSMYYIGRIKAITSSDVLLEDAAWVCDAGLYGKVLVGEAELGSYTSYPDPVAVCRAGVIDFTRWNQAPLPTSH